VGRLIAPPGLRPLVRIRLAVNHYGSLWRAARVGCGPGRCRPGLRPRSRRWLEVGGRGPQGSAARDVYHGHSGWAPCRPASTPPTAPIFWGRHDRAAASRPGHCQRASSGAGEADIEYSARFIGGPGVLPPRHHAVVIPDQGDRTGRQNSCLASSEIVGRGKAIDDGSCTPTPAGDARALVDPPRHPATWDSRPTGTGEQPFAEIPPGPWAGPGSADFDADSTPYP